MRKIPSTKRETAAAFLKKVLCVKHNITFINILSNSHMPQMITGPLSQGQNMCATCFWVYCLCSHASWVLFVPAHCSFVHEWKYQSRSVLRCSCVLCWLPLFACRLLGKSVVWECVGRIALITWTGCVYDPDTTENVDGDGKRIK